MAAVTAEQTNGQNPAVANGNDKRRVIIRTVGLKKTYLMKGVLTEALRGVDIEIFQREFIAVMGPSGSGKSTFFNMIGALDSPSVGRVFIDEVDVAQL
ncbi:MAG TPA: ATP-binding cassette domain-containing protein, partial [Lentisphaeria bacterium]|nr:ATP-binding cassette domain-containing protein [Lentisphaeria bacterium]